MDKETELEIKRINESMEQLEEEQKGQKKELGDLSKAIMRFWHIGMGLGLGLLAERLGLEKLLSKLL